MIEPLTTMPLSAKNPSTETTRCFEPPSQNGQTNTPTQPNGMAVKNDDWQCVRTKHPCEDDEHQRHGAREADLQMVERATLGPRASLQGVLYVMVSADFRQDIPMQRPF